MSLTFIGNILLIVVYVYTTPLNAVKGLIMRKETGDQIHNRAVFYILYDLRSCVY